jgi:hypothetical protein
MLIVRNHIDMVMVDVVGSDGWFIGLGEGDGRERRGSSAKEELVVVIDIPRR